MHFATVRFADHASTSESTPSPEMSAKAAGHIYGVLTHLQGGLVLERLFCGDGTLHPVGEAVVQHLLHRLELDAARRADVGLHIIRVHAIERTNTEDIYNRNKPLTRATSLPGHLDRRYASSMLAAGV